MQRSSFLLDEEMLKDVGLNSEGIFIPNEINYQKQRYINDIFHHSTTSANE